MNDKTSSIEKEKLELKLDEKEFRWVASFTIILPIIPLIIMIWGYFNGKTLIIPGVIFGALLAFYLFFVIFVGIRIYKEKKKISKT